jgi:hypothetical protein
VSCFVLLTALFNVVNLFEMGMLNHWVLTGA